MYDVMIIGGGPAGITAGIYCARANLKTIVFEKESIGGQIASSPLVQNFPGFVSINGAEFANNLYEQATRLGVDIEIEEVLLSLVKLRLWLQIVENIKLKQLLSQQVPSIGYCICQMRKT